MRIIFLGSGAFALPTLNWLAESDHELPLVITQPAKAAGRGRRTTFTPVAAVATQLGLDVLAAENVNDDEVLTKLRDLSPDLGLVIAFGQKLRPPLLAAFLHGCINLHASLLPKYRGAAPINWAIINGEKQTGCTVFRIADRMDAGPILTTRRTDIKPDETAGELHDRLAAIGVDAVRAALELFTPADQRRDRKGAGDQHHDRQETSDQYRDRQGASDPRRDREGAGQAGDAPRGFARSNSDAAKDARTMATPPGTPQDESAATTAPKIKKADGLIDFDHPAQKIADHIRGMTPWPGAATRFQAADGRWEPVQIVRARPAEDPTPPTIPPGQIDIRRYVAAADRFLEILEIKPSSGRIMPWQDYVNGRHVTPPDRFTNPNP